MKNTMKNGKSRGMGSYLRIGVGLTAAVAVMGVIEAGATTYTWSGGGTPDGNWTNSANWSSGVPASANDADLVFSTATGATAINGIANPFLLRHVTFDSGAGAFTLSGWPLTVYGTVANNAASLQTVGNNVTLGANSIWNAASGNLAFTGNISGGTHTVVKSGANKLTLSGVNSFILAGNSGLAGGTLVFSGSTFTNLATGTGDAGLKMPFAATGTTLVLTNGAKYYAPVQAVGSYCRFGRADSKLIVSGAGSVWNQGSDVIVMDSTTGRLVVTDGGQIANTARLFVGFGTSTTGNRLEITNGGKIVSTANGGSFLGYSTGSAGNSIYIGGTNAVTGEKSVWNMGGGSSSLSVGNSASTANNNSVVIDAGGVLSNGVVTLGAQTGCMGNSLVITNGGRVYGKSGVSYIGGSGLLSTAWVGGKNPVTGEKSTWDAGSSFIIASAGSSNTLTVAQDGIVTNILGNGFKLGNVAGASYNTAVITNGGQLFSLSAGMIVGVESGSSWNQVLVHNGLLMTGGSYANVGLSSVGNTVRVTANGLWDAGGKGLFVGCNSTATAPGMSNSVVVTAGGVVTNACGGDRLALGCSPGSAYNSLVVTNGGRFYMDGGYVLVGAYRTSAGGLGAGGNNNVLLIEDGLLDGSVNSYIGNASTGNRVELRGATQWDLNNKTLTVGLNGGTANELKLGSGGTLTDVNTLTIGDGVTSTGNQLTLAGGNVSVATFVLGADNRLAPVVGPSGITAMTVSGTATLADASTVKPIADSSSGYGKYAVLTAGTLVDNGIELDASADSTKWNVSVEGNTLYLEHRETRTLLQVR